MQTFKQARKKLSKSFANISEASASIDDLAAAISILGAAGGEPTTTSVALVTSVFAKAAKGASSLLARLTDKTGPVEQARDLELIFHLVCQESFFRVLHKHIEDTPYLHHSKVSPESLKLPGGKLTELSTSLSGGYIALSEDGSLYTAYSERVRVLLREIYPTHIGIDDEVSQVMADAIQLVRDSIPHQPALHAHFQMESHYDTQQRVRDLQKSLETQRIQMPIASEGAAFEGNSTPLPTLRSANVTDAEAKLAEVCRILSVDLEANSVAIAELDSISESIRKQFDKARNHLENGELVRAEAEFRSVEKLLRSSSEPDKIHLRARSISNLGLISYRRGTPRRARRYFLFAYGLYPDHPNIRSLRALALCIEGRTDEAVEFLADEIKENEPNPGGQQLYVQLLANCGETERALEYINGLATDDTTWIEIRARILMSMGQYSVARSILEDGIDKRPTLEMKEQLAYCLGLPLVGCRKTLPVVLQDQHKEDLDRAIKFLNESLHHYKLQGNLEAELQVLINISAFQSRLGWLKAAQQTLNAALQRSPRSREALENRFIVLQKLGLHEEARNDARTLYSIEESADNATRFTEALLCLDQFRQALKFIAECENTLEEAQDHPALQCCKLQALQERHERKQAEKQAELIEAKFSDSAFALHVLAHYYSSLKKDEKAEELFISAIEHAHGPEKAGITHDYGLHFYQRSNWSRAAEFLTRHITEPRKSHLFGEILNCYYQLRNFQQVMHLCDNVDETELSPLALNVLANTLLELSEFGKAAEVLECLIDHTRRSNYRVTLAQVYHRLGKLERSENLLQDAFNDDPRNLTTLIQLSQVAYQLGLHRQGFDYGIKAYKIDSTSVHAMTCILQVTFLGSEAIELGEHDLEIVQKCRDNHPGIQKIQFEQKEDGRIDPTPILEMAREQHDRMGAILKAYHKNKAPLLTLVEATGLDYWTAWNGMITQRDGKVYMSSGTHDVQSDQLQIALGASQVVMDATSILTAHGLGLLDVASSCFERILIPIVTLDELRNSYNQLKQFAGTHGRATLVPVEDRFVLVEHTAEDLQNERQKLEKILAFLESPQVDIVGLDPEYLHKRENEEPWKSLPESAFFSLAVSQSRRAPLWSDQMAIVEIHKSLNEGKGFCTQAFLTRAKQRGQITNDQLDDALLWLLEHNYTFVSEHASTMARQAQKSEYNVTDFGRSLIQRIGDENWNNESSSRVYGGAFARIWASCPREKRSEWVAAAMTALANTLNSDSVLLNFAIGVLLELKDRPAQHFGLLDMLIQTSEANSDLRFKLRVLLRATSGSVERTVPLRQLLIPATLAEWRRQRWVQAMIEALRANL